MENLPIHLIANIWHKCETLRMESHHTEIYCGEIPYAIDKTCLRINVAGMHLIVYAVLKGGSENDSETKYSDCR